MADLVTLFAILVGSLIVLMKSSAVVIDNASKIAKYLNMSELVIGFLLLSVATSLPELSVAAASLNQDQIGITIGNLLGANVSDLSLVIAAIALFAPMKIYRKELKRLAGVLLMSSLIPLSLLILSEASQFIGVMLLFIFIVYATHFIRTGKTPKLDSSLEDVKKRDMPGISLWFALGIGGLILSSNYAVSSAAEIASLLGIAQSVIGATIISIGTTLPEMTVSLTGVRRGKSELAIGNAIGSTLVNITLILGFVLVTSPFKINFTIFETLVFFSLATNIVLRYFLDEGILSNREAIIMLLIYIIFLMSVFGVQFAIL